MRTLEAAALGLLLLACLAVASAAEALPSPPVFYKVHTFAADCYLPPGERVRAAGRSRLLCVLRLGRVRHGRDARQERQALCQGAEALDALLLRHSHRGLLPLQLYAAALQQERQQ